MIAPFKKLGLTTAAFIFFQIVDQIDGRLIFLASNLGDRPFTGSILIFYYI